MVAKFPAPEPWPTELFAEYGIADLEQLVHDAQAEITRRRAAAATDLTCPDCGDVTHPAQTLCEGCGSRLTPTNSNGSGRSDLDGTSAAGAERRTVPMQADDPRCTCGQTDGICTYCTLQSYEPLPLEARNMAMALDMTAAALARPANVTSIDRYSKKVS